ncbi:MAG: AAA family ATPase [Synechococcales bacterium]|nr:AAA family ATPase [Synechococcales bacterium]
MLTDNRNPSLLSHLVGYAIIEQIYTGSRTSVYRALENSSQRPVVIKLLNQAYPSFTDLLQFRNQYTIAKNLDLPGIVKPYSLEVCGNSYALVMEDFGGVSLQQYARTHRPNLADGLAIALQLADILEGLHQHRVIHKDIKPTNVLIHPESKQVKLIDFSIASLLPRETQEIQNPNVLEGTLAYLSPEQTGRMNRGIDYRSDFYSLGVTLYELLTGQLPFQSDDPMELMHCHLAKPPIAPHHILPGIPPTVSAIILKLMAKNAEDRYQSARGLRHDLAFCLEQIQKTGSIPPFELAVRDGSDRFLIPEKLYGREAEVAELLAAFDRVAGAPTSQIQSPRSELVLVTGFSGIGKTAVINEVHKPIVRQRGYFIKGKFDQFNRNIPFSAFVQAFRDLMGQLLSESDSQLAIWSTKILEAVGENGRVIVEVIPELERIIGPQPPAPELSGIEAQSRFNLLFQKFIQVFTAPDHPLVIFLDDLQWADLASLNLLNFLMGDASSGYLLVLGAYRDNEVFPAHPLMLMLEQLEQSQAIINTIALKPLLEITVNHLVADTLSCCQELAQPLTQLVYQKTKGNPFFATQFLKALHEAGWIQFQPDLGYWQCDLTAVRQLTLTDDVVEFMALQLRKLPTATQDVLKLAACIGNQFDLTTLAVVSQQSEAEVAVDLWKALQEGLVLPQSEVYKFYLGEQRTGDSPAQTVAYRFLHDRVQQAAYTLILPDQKAKTHLDIGRLLLANTSPQTRAYKLFDIVNQLNLGAELITSETEREQLVELNLAAGCKAKQATAYAAAGAYLNVGIQHLAANSWQSQYALSLSIYETATEVAYLDGQFETMQALANQVSQSVRTWFECIKIEEIKMMASIAQGDLPGAIAIGLQTLQRLGIELPASPTDAEVDEFLAETAALVPASGVLELLHLPPLTDPVPLAALRILDPLFTAAYAVAPQLIPLTSAWGVKLSIQHGNDPLSVVAYSQYGMLLCGERNQIDTGYQFGELALQLAARYNDKALQTRALCMVAAFILPWKLHWRSAIPHLHLGYQTGIEAGVLLYASFNFYHAHRLAYLVGEELTTLEAKLLACSEAIRQIKQELPLDYTVMIRQVVLNWLGRSVNPISLKGKAYDATRSQPLYLQNNNREALFYLCLHHAILAYGLGQCPFAIESIRLAATYLDSVPGQIVVPLFYFYDSLIGLAHLSSVSPAEQEEILETITVNQAKMAVWAEAAPMNYLHKLQLVEAERFRVLDQKHEALDLYDRAIAGAKANEYIQEEALANELAAKFYLSWGKDKVAAGYMQEAYYGYARWGAKAKTEDLELRYPDLLHPILKPPGQPLNIFETLAPIAAPHCSLTSSANPSYAAGTSVHTVLDFTAILKASQTLAGTIHLEELFQQLTQIILQYSGGDRCALILPTQQGEWRVEAIATPEVKEFRAIPLDDAKLPIKLIYYVKRTQEVVVIDQLETELPVIDDYLAQVQPQSVLCLPILGQGQVMGILSLENRLTRGVFTGDRILMLNFLCTQAAISIQNAYLYQEVRDFAAELERSLQDAQQKSQELAETVALSNGQKRILELIAQGLSLKDLLHEIALYIEAQSHHEAYCSFLFVDEERRLRHGAAPSLPGSYNALVDGVQIGPNVGSCGTAAFYKASVIVEDIATDPFWEDYRIALDYGLRACTSTPILGDEGQVLATLAMYQPQPAGLTPRDRTLIEVATYLARIAIERHHTDNELKHLNTQLEDQILQLQQAQLQLVQNEKMASLGNLVAGIAHEINNPIGFLNGSIDNAKDYARDLLSYIDLYQHHHPDAAAPVRNKEREIDLAFLKEDLPKLLHSMQSATDRIKGISTSLRTFSRADTEHKVSADLHEGLDSTLLILRYRLKANEFRPAIQVMQNYGDIPLIECFPGQLNQVFMNILANAIDACDESNQGKQFEDIEAYPNQITIRTAVEGNSVMIAIADNGTGMPESVRANIFDHLFTTKQVGKGTGLGLAIARQIVVEKHGGSLEVESEPGKGAEFFIRLPIHVSEFPL